MISHINQLCKGYQVVITQRNTILACSFGFYNIILVNLICHAAVAEPLYKQRLIQCCILEKYFPYKCKFAICNCTSYRYKHVHIHCLYAHVTRIKSNSADKKANVPPIFKIRDYIHQFSLNH